MRFEVCETRGLLAASAFPGAEGFGAAAVGGRGGDVYHVTNLSDSGQGSLREAIASAKGPRTVVFDVAGTILLRSELVIDKSYLTIAGQTAPGDGITLRGERTKIVRCHDVIVRFLRFRAGDENATKPQGRDSLDIADVHDIVLDHISASWGIDEVLSAAENTRNLTLQWSIVAEGLDNSLHPKGPHSMGSIISVDGATLHHNLYAHNANRNPRLTGRVDFVNNVIYNWGATAALTGNETEAGQFNLQNNYFLAGPDTESPGIVLLARSPDHQIWFSGNIVDSKRNGRVDGATVGAGAIQGIYTSAPERIGYPVVVTESPHAALDHVLAASGASLARDAVDRRVVAEALAGGGRIIDSPRDVGGWPKLAPAAAPRDTDRDGMPDSWEKALGLDPKKSRDGNQDRDRDGYTNLEEYLQARATNSDAAPARTTAIVTAAADATVTGFNPDDLTAARDGRRAGLFVRDFRGATTNSAETIRLQKAHIRFDTPPDMASIFESRLELYWNRDDRGGLRYDVFALREASDYGTNSLSGVDRLSEHWDEDKINYDNAPGNVDSGRDGSLNAEHAEWLGTFVSPSSSRSLVAVSGSKLRDFLLANRDGRVTFILVAAQSTENLGIFASRESTAGHPPRLVVEYGT